MPVLRRLAPRAAAEIRLDALGNQNFRLDITYEKSSKVRVRKLDELYLTCRLNGLAGGRHVLAAAFPPSHPKRVVGGYSGGKARRYRESGTSHAPSKCRPDARHRAGRSRPHDTARRSTAIADGSSLARWRAGACERAQCRLRREPGRRAEYEWPGRFGGFSGREASGVGYAAAAGSSFSVWRVAAASNAAGRAKFAHAAWQFRSG